MWAGIIGIGVLCNSESGEEQEAAVCLGALAARDGARTAAGQCQTGTCRQRWGLYQSQRCQPGPGVPARFAVLAQRAETLGEGISQGICNGMELSTV